MIRDGSTIAISLRPRSTLEPTLGRARIPTIRLTPRTLASYACALTGAVDLTSVAGSTDEGHCATPSAQKASKRFGHRRSSDNRRTHRHTSTSVLCSQHARTRWVGRGHGIGSTATFKPMPCLFSPVVLEVALHRRHRATLAAGATKSEAVGADGNRGTAVPPFPQRYDCYGIENKNNGRTSEASGLITRPPNRVRLTLDLRKPRRSPRLRRKSYVHRLPPNMRHFRAPSTSSPGRDRNVPEAASSLMTPQPTARNASSWSAVVCTSVETRA